MIWFKLHTQNGRNIRLSVPISLFVLRDLLDSMLDSMTLVCLFAPKAPRSGSRFSPHAVKEILRTAVAMLGSVTQDGPYDLVDVAADNVSVCVKIR